MQHVITAGKILLGPVGEIVSDGAVLVEDDRIIAVGPREAVGRRADEHAERHDFPHHTVLPGLIDCHVHLALDTSDAVVDHLLDTDDTDLLLGMAGRAQLALRAGVTTVRDLGDRSGLAVRVRDAIARGDLAGPRVVCSGPPLTLPRGHCWFFGGEVDGPDEIRRRIARNAELGVDLIKVMASGGQITPNSPPSWQSQFSTDELKLVVAEADRHGLAVAAHAHGTEAIASAAEAGVTTIEHCTWQRAGGEGFDRRDDVARLMAERGIFACVACPPTWRELMERFGPERAAQIGIRIRWLDELGVPLIAGTDAGLRTFYFDDFVRALELYAHLGFAPDRIIEMATTTAARALGLADTTGRIGPGHSADLLVVDGDPLADLGDLRNLRLVFARGTAHQPAP
ncbi:amidohydrolase family protein [Saccharopolyspora rosea]|uniref:Amidohydrolase family protein n=1 Tax=Saccharopolyspora rosea TaxID=524884 RepID=A0ABW3FVP8_9PSEU|nr:amidohydrolase family protein [Saccharopolyspora rosea]